MKIVAWNIRAGGGKRQVGIFDQLCAWAPDVIALSEFRGTPASQTLAAQLADAGWVYQKQSIDPEKRATNALLTASKYPLTTLDIAGAPEQPRRWLATQIHSPSPLIYVNMHIPNYNTGFKYPYHQCVLNIMKHWSLGPAVFAGDTNSGKAYIDDATGIFWKREHEWMEAIEALNWKDAYRQLHKDGRVYSWYSHRDNGFRLDQAFLSPDLSPALTAMRYEWGATATLPNKRAALSDHAAMIFDLDLTKLAANTQV